MSSMYYAHILFGWFATGHTEITMWAVSGAISYLSSRHLLERMGTGTTRMKVHLSGLWLMNVCQDFDKGNILGKCGIEWPGGQVHHFMRDTDETKESGYSRSYAWIYNETYQAWQWFKKAFPEKKPEVHHSGFMGFLDKVKEYNPASLVVKGVSEVIEEVEMLNAQKHLARALHTLQDAFSPAHTLRHDRKEDYDAIPAPGGSGIVIRDVYCWDAANKNKVEGGWPGHWSYDLADFNHLTKALELRAYYASLDLIVAALANLYNDAGYFVSALNQALGKHLARAF